MAETNPNPPLPFPPRPGIRPVEPPPLQPTPAPAPIPQPAVPPQSDPGDEDPAQPEALPAAARAASPDPLGLVRLATIHAEQAEQCRVMCIEQAAILADQLANSVAFSPTALLTRGQIVGCVRALAAHIRALKNPNAAMERAGGPA
jgi:hypothetical protein